MHDVYVKRLLSSTPYRDSDSRIWPNFISFDVTSECNLRCIHCYNNSGNYHTKMEKRSLIDIAKQIRDLKPYNVCLCGGEPLLQEYLFDIIDELKKGNITVTMVSNGLLMTDDMCKKLIDHGIYGMQISLDGAYSWQHDTIRGLNGAYDKAINAIKILSKNGMKQISTSCLPSKLVIGYLTDYIELCLSIGVNNVRCMSFLSSGRGRDYGKKLMLNEEGYFDFCRELLKIKRKYNKLINIEWDDALSLILYEKFLYSKKNKTMNMEIRSNGDIVPTDYFPIVVGNTNKHTLTDYWFGGYDSIWKNEKVVDYIKDFHNTSDMEKLCPIPYGDKEIRFDIIDD